MSLIIPQHNESFYTGLLEWDTIKVTFLVCHLLETFIGPFIIYSLIWYERFSVDLRYRTVINQLLSHCWWIQFVGCIFCRNSYLSFLLIGPFSLTSCDIIISFGHFLYICTISVLGLRQIIKFLYIFQWKNVVSINDNFFAFYLALCIYTLSAIFVFVCYVLGYLNDDLDYHICTGKTPQENFQATFIRMGFTENYKSNQIWFKDGTISDPMEFFSNVLSSIILLLTCQMWWYAIQDKANNISQVISYVKCCKTKTTILQPLEEKFCETKSKILGNGLSLIFLLLCLAALIPLYLARLRAKKDISEVNHGWTRALVYFERMTLPLMSTIICPLLIIQFNSKIKKSIIKELKETKVVKWVLEKILK